MRLIAIIASWFIVALVATFATSRHLPATTGHPLASGMASGEAFGVTAVAGGVLHTCALSDRQAVWCWGRNGAGALGIGSNDDAIHRRWPSPVDGLPDPVAEVVTGAMFTCARTTQGVLWCWGSNTSGQLGIGTVPDFESGVYGEPSPRRVVGLDQPVVSVAAGFRHTCAVTRDSRTWCWGYLQGEDIDRMEVATPTLVAGLPSGVVQVSVGIEHTCARTSGGIVACWGLNSKGQLGNGSLETQWQPTAVHGLPAGMTALAAGGAHSCALRGDGRIYCWGGNEFGQLGDGTTEPRLEPVEVASLPRSARAITAGGAQTCALLDDGSVWCWGRNNAGQLGTGPADPGSDSPHPRPEPVLGLAGPAIAVVSSLAGHPRITVKTLEDASDDAWLQGHACAILAGGRLQCWGGNGYGQLGDGSYHSRSEPRDLFLLAASILLPRLEGRDASSP